MPIRKTKAQYDAIATSYESLMGERQKRKIEYLNTLLPTPLPSPRLDVGAGTGLVSKILQERFISVDISAAMLSLAPSPQIIADMHALPFADDIFALVVSVSALSTAENFRQCIDEMLRVLRPGGILGLSVLSTEDIWGVERYLACHPLVRLSEKLANGPDRLFMVTRT